MGLSGFDPSARERVSWNAGRKAGAKRAFKPRRIWSIRFFLDRYGRFRDQVRFDLAIDSKLRGCHLVKIRISDIVCNRKVRTSATVVQQNTGRPVQFELMNDARASLLTWLELRDGSVEDYAFSTRCNGDRSGTIGRKAITLSLPSEASVFSAFGRVAFEVIALWRIWSGRIINEAQQVFLAKAIL